MKWPHSIAVAVVLSAAGALSGRVAIAGVSSGTQPGRTASMDAAKRAKRQAEAHADFQRLFKPADRRRILAMTGEQVVKIVKSEKDFRRLFEVYHWCKLRRGAIAGDLVALLTKSREVGLTNSADLIIWERIKSGHLKFHGHGWVVDDDLFTVAGRASWLLKVMTGRNPGTVKMKSTAQDLAALSAKWQASDRAKLLKKHIEKFMLVVRYYGPKDKGRYSLTLRVPVVKDQRLPFWPAAQLSKAQAEKIVEHLDRTGILAAAGNLHNKGWIPPKGPTYTLTVTGPNELLLYEPLGWDLEMLQRLDGLRKVLDGGAAKAMDKLLAALAPQRKKWQKPAAKTAKRKAL